MVAWLERRQVALYLTTIAVAAVVGTLLPGAGNLDAAIEPVLAVLLLATFLGVPFAGIGRSLRDGRFLVAVGVLGFVVVPVVVFLLSRVVADQPALLVGVLLVLLAPCIDYVVVFAGLAGGAADRLLAVAPLTMLAQVLLLPLFLLLSAGPEALAAVRVEPFVRAFLVLIAAPMVAAALVQWWARHRRAGVLVERAAAGAVVPLLMATLFAVVASQVRTVGGSVPGLLTVAAVFVAFVVVMVPLGIAAGRLARLDVPGTRALVFSGVTRNSLVVLPIALALPPPLSSAPVVVVTQTLVELVAVVVLVRLVPRFVPDRGAAAT